MPAAVDLYWIPLGAGGHSVRFNGRIFEALEAARQHRHPCDLYHAALIVELDDERYAIELAPSPNADCFAMRSAAGAAGRSRTSATRSAGPAASAATRDSPAACSSSRRARRRRSGDETS